MKVTLRPGDNFAVLLIPPEAFTDAVVTVEVEGRGTSSGQPEAPAPTMAAVARAKERVDAGLPALGGGAPVRADVPEIVALLLDAFAGEGDPEVLSVARIADHLEAADPAAWGRWAGRTDRLAMVGRTIKGRLRRAGLDVSSVRLWDVAGGLAAYRLADIREALS